MKSLKEIVKKAIYYYFDKEISVSSVEMSEDTFKDLEKEISISTNKDVLEHSRRIFGIDITINNTLQKGEVISVADKSFGKRFKVHHEKRELKNNG